MVNYRIELLKSESSLWHHPQARRAGVLAQPRRARAEAEEKQKGKNRNSDKDEPGAGLGRRRSSKVQPRPEAQHNFTDPESRIMKGPDGFVQAYNAQAA